MNAPDEHSLWADKILKPAWAVVAAGVTLLVIISLWTPDVEPIMPEKTALVGDTLALGQPDTAGSSDGFSSRPLFLGGRRPIVSLEEASELAQPEAVNEDSVEQIEGVTLLGIFSSADASGVIVSEKGVGQRRIFEGDQLQGWELVGVEPRGAVFSGGGGFARLDMQIVSKVAGSPIRRKLDNDRTGLGAEPNAGTVGTAEEAPSFVPSFENMYQSRAAPARDKAEAGDAESSRRKQGDTDNEK